MGTSTTAITAADFVTPPELSSWALAANPAGRIGGLRLELAAGPAGTTLQTCYQQIPLRVLPPFHFTTHDSRLTTHHSLIYLLNPTAGLMDGDAHLVKLTAGADSRAIVTGQSATRIHPSIHSFSSQQWQVRVESGAVLVVLPGPNIPFQGCRYYQRADIDLEPGAGLIWGDIWYAGRYARDNASEWFQFDRLVQELTVRRDGQLIYRDRFAWKGPWDRDTAAWQFGYAGASGGRQPPDDRELSIKLSRNQGANAPRSPEVSPACGSLFITGPVPEESLRAPAPLFHAWFPTAAGDTCFRCHGPSEAVTSCIVRTALSAAAVLAGQQPGEAWLPGRELAPCHWFS